MEDEEAAPVGGEEIRAGHLPGSRSWHPSGPGSPDSGDYLYSQTNSYSM